MLFLISLYERSGLFRVRFLFNISDSPQFNCFAEFCIFDNIHVDFTFSGGVVIPGMPPQSVLDYERDLALYDYYKQKYEQDWLRSRISPPSPFKRFINYNPTKLQPPTNQTTQVERNVPAHVIPIQLHANPPYTQPPPPGDATPTEEDAGLYAFRAPTPPGNYFVPPGRAPWDPAQFEGNLTAERARIIQEEEYYNQMHKKLHDERAWGRGRHPEPYDHQGHGDRRSGDRHDRDRRRRGLSPTMDRGRSWERDADRYHSRQRRSDHEMARPRRRSREREYDSRSRRRDESQRESRSSRPESSRTRKRPQEHSDDMSYRPSSRRSGRDRDVKKSTTSDRKVTPERSVSNEPYPPGEGDGTPVRDESRVEFMNERIKVKVINEKAKSKEERRRRKSSEGRAKETSRKSEKSHSVRQDTERRVVKSRDTPTRVDETKIESNPVPEQRSPTPTLDEEADDVIQTGHRPLQESENDTLSAELKTVDKPTRPESGEKARKPNDESIASKRARPSEGKKVVRKAKVKVKLTKDSRKRRMHSEEKGVKSATTGKAVSMPKSK